MVVQYYYKKERGLREEKKIMEKKFWKKIGEKIKKLGKKNLKKIFRNKNSDNNNL